MPFFLFAECQFGSNICTPTRDEAQCAVKFAKLPELLR